VRARAASAGEVFEASRQLIAPTSDSPAILVCLCAYLCHALMHREGLEHELGATFVRTVLLELLRSRHQPLAERVACDLFRKCALDIQSCRLPLAALSCKLLRSLAGPPRDGADPAQTKVLTPNIADNGDGIVSGAASSAPDSDAHTHLRVSCSGAVTCVRELVEVLACDNASRVHTSTDWADRAGAATPEGGGAGGTWEELLDGALLVVHHGRDSEAVRCVISCLLPSFVPGGGGGTSKALIKTFRWLLSPAAPLVPSTSIKSLGAESMGAGSVKSQRHAASKAQASAAVQRAAGWQLIDRLPEPLYTNVGSPSLYMLTLYSKYTRALIFQTCFVPQVGN
jgi:hypothetical protein